MKAHLLTLLCSYLALSLLAGLPAVAVDSSPSFGAPALTPTATPGLAVAGVDEGRSSVLMSTGGHSQELLDVSLLLARYARSGHDVAPHPEVMIYPGIPYLMPWRAAEKILVPFNTSMKCGDKIACAGFPEGLNWVRYDGRWVVNNHVYNHLMLVKDIMSQVVCIEFLQDHGAWAELGWTTLPGNWHVIDYVNAEVKGQPRIEIVTQVLDERATAHRIVVHTMCEKVKRATTLFIPQPLADIMLACTERTPGSPVK